MSDDARVLSIVPKLPPAEDGPDQQIVAAIEELLADAKSGKVRALAFATSTNEGNIESYIVRRHGHVFPLIAAVTHLFRRAESILEDA